MLKKAGNIVIILLLLVATGGMPVTRHYCGLVQKSISFYATPKACCGSSCNKCHNVFKFTKVNDDFESGSSGTAQALIDYVTLHTSFYIDLFDSLNSSPDIDLSNHRAIFTLKAGHSPASLGNFRC